jgi:hypothetical protein
MEKVNMDSLVVVLDALENWDFILNLKLMEKNMVSLKTDNLSKVMK